MLDYDGFRKEQAARRKSGDVKQLGVGFSTYVEMCGLAPSRILGALRYGAGGWEAATLRFLPTGTVQIMSGATPHGQGHATTFSQIVADELGVGVDDVEFLAGDTAVVPLGMDTYGRPQPLGWWHRRSIRRPERSSRKRAPLPRTSSKSQPRICSTKPAASASPVLTGA